MKEFGWNTRQLQAQPYYSSVRATPFAFRATQKEVCLYAERLPSFLMLRWKINARKFKHILGLEKYAANLFLVLFSVRCPAAQSPMVKWGLSALSCRNSASKPSTPLRLLPLVVVAFRAGSGDSEGEPDLINDEIIKTGESASAEMTY